MMFVYKNGTNLSANNSNDKFMTYLNLKIISVLYDLLLSLIVGNKTKKNLIKKLAYVYRYEKYKK